MSDYAQERTQDREENRRERAKREKLERIRAVARRLFAEQGFESTTTRQIAAEADIGSGTLFLYAPTKEHLLVRIFEEEIVRAVDRAFECVPARPLVDQVLHVFNALIVHHAADPALARVFVKELPFVDAREGVVNFVNQTYLRFGALIDAAKARGEIAPDVPARLLAQNLFASFFQHMQAWLSGRVPPVGPNDPRLRDAFELQLRGTRPRS